MKTYLTEIRAKSVLSGKLETFSGPEVLGITANDAQNNLFAMGLPYCMVTFEKLEVVDMTPGGNGIKQKPKYN